MSNKKKIVIVISIISILILCFNVSVFAEEDNSYTLTEDTVITMVSDPMPNKTLNYHISFTMRENGQNVFMDCNKIQFVNGTITATKTSGTGQSGIPRSWIIGEEFTFYSGQTINESDIAYLEANTDFVVPEPPPHLEPSFWETVSGFFSEALASGTAIVNWMTITPIALIPLALYCLIVIIAITKRMIKG